MEAPQWFFTKALSHRQKVLRLFKKSMRTCDHWFLPDFLEMRAQKVIVRARFDLYKNEMDMRKAKTMLIDGVKELWEKQHPNPFIFAYDPHGPAQNRAPPPPDMILDTWSPQEKDLYPKYFAKREQRKKELMEIFDKIHDERAKELPK